MNDLASLTLARAPQRATGERIPPIRLYPVELSEFARQIEQAPSQAARGRLARERLETLGLSWATKTYPGKLLAGLDAALTAAGNRLEPDAALKAADLEAASLKDALNKMASQRERLADAILAMILAPSPNHATSAELRTHAARLLTLFGLLELLRDDPRLAPDAKAVARLLRQRSILFPAFARRGMPTASDLQNAMASVHAAPTTLVLPADLIIRAGVSDHYVLRSEWLRYEAGELAHVENVMPTETRSREHVRTEETETLETAERESSTFAEQDLQTTERFELSVDTAQEIRLAINAEAQIDTSGQYGPTKVDTQIGGGLDYSREDSERRVASTMRESVARAVNRLETRVSEKRTRRTLTRIQETNRHAFANETGGPLTGVYRWVDKVQRFQLFRFPNRMLLEFQIPEPAAWWRWLQEQRSATGVDVPPPTPFTLDGEAESSDNKRLSFADLTAANYAEIGARYGALGLAPPPVDVVTSEIFVHDTANPRDTAAIAANDPVRFLKLGEIAVPAGCRAAEFWWRPMTWHEDAWSNSANTPSLILGLGNSTRLLAGPRGAFGPENDAASLGPFDIDGGVPDDPGLEQGKLIVSLRTDNIRGFSISVTVRFKPTPDTLTRWRIATYETLADAYYALERAHREAVRAAQVSQGVRIEGASPERNREIVRTELRRSLLDLLGAAAYWTGSAVDRGGAAGPRPNPIETARRGPYIQFLEHAFEWDRISYVLYPYFWGERWGETAAIEGADPEFAAFLRSGSARVVAPVRPGFEKQVTLFLEHGLVWGGGPVPGPDDEDYVSIAEEIRSLDGGPEAGEPGAWWDTRLPTALVWLEGGQALPAKPAADVKLGDPT